MLDDDAKERRELIFDKYRNISIEIKELDEQFTSLRETRNDKTEERRRLNRLIKIMLNEDCCPVMAQLKYDEEITGNKRNGNKSVASLYTEDDYDDEEIGESASPPAPPRSPRSLKKTIKRKLINILKRI